MTDLDRSTSPFFRMAAAGFAATAITYGPARMGFGLFLTEFRSVFSISTQAAGLVSSLGFFGFFAGLLISQLVTDRHGPRLPVVSGLIAATAGLAIVAAAPNLPILALGVFLAMSSAGFSWTPFNNAIHRMVQEKYRPAALSTVSTGTGLGVAGAGIAAFVMSVSGVSWRLCWGVFAVGSALSLAGNWIVLRDVAGTPGPGRAQQWRMLVRQYAVPLFGIGFCYGVTSAIYISFAADRIAQAGGLAGLPTGTSGSFLFICYGVFGLLGLCTARVREVVGLTWLLRLLMLASAASFGLLALTPTAWAGVVLSAGFQGVNVMMTSAVLAFWSDRLFPALPSQSFTAVLLAVAAGSVLGPTVAGFTSDALGAAPMLLGVAALATATAAVIRTRYISERPVPEMSEAS